MMKTKMKKEKERITVSLSKETYQRITEEASLLGLSVPMFISVRLKKEFDDKKKRDFKGAIT